MNSDALAGRIEALLGRVPSGAQTAPPERPPPSIANYELLNRIGGGSYGDVWLARSVTGALRAIKVVWRSRFDNERPYEREFRGIVRFEPISRSHPGVVHVLHVGRDDEAGYFFYVMERADDAGPATRTPHAALAAPVESTAAAAHAAMDYVPKTLASELKIHTRLPVVEAVTLGVQLAGAVGHLHRHGLVHRDIKPSNVIFVEGQPKLADIGLVTGVEEDRSFVGTEGYIPPEGPGTERADLFALGRLLYEMATGQHRREFPGLPADLDRWPGNEREQLIELSEVLARACAPEAKGRHRNAAELAGDLNLILAGRSVRRAYRTERRLRHARLFSIAALAVVLAASTSNWLQRRQREVSEGHARREAALREEAQKSLARAETAERESQQQLYTALLEQARATVLTAELGQRVRALDAVRRAAAISNSAELRGVAVAALALPDLRFERDLPTWADWTLLRLDPAFERVALCRGNGPVEIRAVSDHRLLATLPASTNRAAYVAFWSSDGRFLAVKRDHDTRNWRVGVEVWDVASARRVLLLQNVTRSAVSFHPRLPRLLVGLAPASAALWDISSGAQIAHYDLPGEVALVKFSPDGEYFAALHGAGRTWAITGYRTDGGVSQWSHTFADVHPNSSSDFGWHPDGRQIVVAGGLGIVRLVDLATGDSRELGRHKAQAVFTAFSPEGRFLFTGGWDRELICWDGRAMRRAFTIAVESQIMQIRADGRQCAVVRSPNVRVQLHAFESPALHREFAGDLGGIRYAAFSPDGRWLAASGTGERLAVWDLTRNGAAALLKKSAEAHVAFAPNGDLFVSRIGDCSRWRVSPGTNGLEPLLHRLELTTPAGFSSLCLVSNGVLFNGTRGSKVASLDALPTEHGAWIPTGDGRVAASPDGRWLGLQRRYTPDLHVYRLLPGLERVAKLTNESLVRNFEFSPKGDELAVGTQSGVEIWSTTSWQRTRQLKNFSGVLYSPDGRTFWLSSGLRSASLHDARTAELILPLPANTMPLALSPDGRHLAASLNARHIQVWDLAEVRQRLRELGLDWK